MRSQNGCDNQDEVFFPFCLIRIFNDNVTEEGRRLVDMIMLLSLCRLDILFLAPPNAHLQESRPNMISYMRLRMAVHESWASLARKRDGICS